MLRAEEGSYDTVRITSNCKWVVTCRESWIIISASAGENSSRIKISARENYDIYARTGKVTITSEGLPPRVIEVMQKAKHEE